MWTTSISFWDDFLDPLKVTFDGENKLIYINDYYSTINVKIDVYSAFKRWLKRRQNTSFPIALRSIGGDVVGGGLYAGDIYFLTNNYQIVINHPVAVSGVLYSDNVNLSTYIIQSGGGVTSTVSNLAYAYNTIGATVPTATDIANQVWSTDPSVYGTSSAAGKLNKVDTIKTTTDNIFALNA